MPEPDLTFSSGQTYVAFSDLFGFKEMMKDRKEAYEALNYLFNSACALLQGNDNVKGLAVSDCVISWAVDSHLENIKDFISNLHNKMIKKRYLMRTTIAFGEFRYEDRIELSNLSKEMIWGGAYLTAYLANEKAEIGSIVLVDDGLAETVQRPNEGMWRKTKKPRGWEYFWSVDNPEQIERLIKKRKESHRGRYEWLKDIYQGRFHMSHVSDESRDSNRD